MLWMTVCMAVSAGLRGPFDLDAEGRGHVGVQFHLEVDPSELLQRLVERDLPAVDLRARLLVDGFRDVGRRYRTEQAALAAGARLDRHRAAVDLGGERLRGLPFTPLARVTIAAHGVGLPLRSRSRLQCQA